MEIYSIFAQVYDELMDAPYQQWAELIEGFWLKYGEKPHLVLDLACGTGSMIAELTKSGYDTIGVDISPEMLMMARMKNPSALLLNQDMRELELYGTVDAVLCLCDSLNYILEHNELTHVFKLVKNYLNPDGLFVFDINTIYKFEHILSDNNFSHVGENAAYIWENFYDAKSRLNEYRTTFFVKAQKGTYARHEEIHVQKAYTDQEIKDALHAAGLELVAIHEESSKERAYYIAKNLTFL
ncbi:MAG: class I SAM-dependent methyltransferase [Defluviitaleaceae bacterium]|nr:class I SAM-dependent methyltransferase [Defluviitaleaceae bacterium]